MRPKAVRQDELTRAFGGVWPSTCGGEQSPTRLWTTQRETDIAEATFAEELQDLERAPVQFQRRVCVERRARSTDRGRRLKRTTRRAPVLQHEPVRA